MNQMLQMKLHPLWEGPAVVVDVRGPVTRTSKYLDYDENGHPIERFKLRRTYTLVFETQARKDRQFFETQSFTVHQHKEGKTETSSTYRNKLCRILGLPLETRPEAMKGAKGWVCVKHKPAKFRKQPFNDIDWRLSRELREGEDIISSETYNRKDYER